MSILVADAGLQTFVQAAARHGYRHLGVPWSGAADPLSLGLANRLVGNVIDAPALEVTLSGTALEFDSPARVAVTGARCKVHVDHKLVAMHRRIDVAAGSTVRLGASERGVRAYVAVQGGIDVAAVLGSCSTYYPARLGGFDGRALRSGDRLGIGTSVVDDGERETPESHRLAFSSAWTLRATRGAECDMLSDDPEEALFGQRFSISGRNDRMGIELGGPSLPTAGSADLDSRPVFPGTVQCPPSGSAFLLGADAQTTGGYPRVAEVIRADRYLIGQLRTGNGLRFLERDFETAAEDYSATLAFWEQWLPDAGTLI